MSFQECVLGALVNKRVFPWLGLVILLLIPYLGQKSGSRRGAVLMIKLRHLVRFKLYYDINMIIKRHPGLL